MKDVDSLNLIQLTALIAAEKRLTRLASRRPLGVARRKQVRVAASHGYTIDEPINRPPTVRASNARASKKRAVKEVSPRYGDPEHAKHLMWRRFGHYDNWPQGSIAATVPQTFSFREWLHFPPAKFDRPLIEERSIIEEI